MRTRRALRDLLRWCAVGASLGAVVALVNFITRFEGTDYGRAFLVALLIFWSGAGLAAALAAFAVASLVRGRLLPAGESRGSLRTRGKRWRNALARAWIVASGLGLAALVAYLGSAPRFSGFIDDNPRDLSAEEAGPPNVILVSLDTTRPDRLGAYGSPRSLSPSFDGLAARGTLFTRAVSTSSWTIPAHASFFTGMAPSHMGPPFGPRGSRRWVKLPERALTLAEIFRDSGYHTAGFIGGPTLQSWFGFHQGFEIYRDARPVSFSTRAGAVFGAGTARDLLRADPARFLHFLDPPFVSLVNYFHDERYALSSDLRVEMLGGDIRWSLNADEVNHRIFAWLDHRPRRPYFLFVNYFDPHDPYETHPGQVLPGIDARTGFIRQSGLMKAVLTSRRDLDAGEKEALEAQYGAEIAWMDMHLGKLLERLDAEGDLRNAVVAIVSDHGEALGERGLLFHGHAPYGEMTNMAFLLAGRGVPEALRVEEPVSGIDLAPTLLDLAGLDVTWGAEGRSLAPVLGGGTVEAAPIFSEVFGGTLSLPAWAVFSADSLSVEWEGMKLIRSEDGPSELYDLRSDPGETTNIIESEPERAALLGGLLDAYAQRMPGGVADEEPSQPADVLEMLRDLGYVQ